MGQTNALFECVACTVCSKRPGITGDTCHKSLGQRNPLCRNYDKCRIEEKSEKQLDYVVSPVSHCTFLEACPGSGKTEVVGLKAAYEMRQWQRSLGGIAILTFTNNAADVIRERVQQFVGTDKISFPHYVGTIDSWLYGYVANPFAHALTGYGGEAGDRRIRLIEPSSNAPFLNSYATKYKYKGTGHIWASQFCLMADSSVNFRSGNQAVDRARKALHLESWRVNDLTQTKERFWKDGFVTYDDVEQLSTQLLTQQSGISVRLAKRFPLIIVDECQDLSEAQLQILDSLLSRGVVLHFVGDMDQAIHGFREVDPAKVKAFVEAQAFGTLNLSENFRSYQPISDVCSKLLGRSGIKGQPCSSKESTCVYFTYANGKEPELVERFVRYLQTHGFKTGKSAILVRGKTTLKRLRPALDDRKITDVTRLPTALHLWQSENAEARKDALSCVGALVVSRFYKHERSDSRHYYCPESVSSPLQWRLMIAHLLNACLQHKTLSDVTSSWKEWVKVLNAELAGIVAEHCEGADSSIALKFSSPKGLSSASVIDSLDAITQHANGSIRIATIHSVKGETLDAVMLVSAKNKSGGVGGHWKEWLEPTEDGGEHTRFAFVASSRPKYLLAWAVPTPKPGDEKRIRDLGFKMIDGG